MTPTTPAEPTTLLSVEDKLTIVNQHIRNLDYNIYGLELDLLVENASQSPDTDRISTINTQLAAINAKRAVLVTEQQSIVE
jgi:hypothetical protein